METLHAYQPVFELDPKKRLYKLLPIPLEKWKWWFKCKCRVSGMVVKPVSINGVLVDKGICDARVHICEVAKVWLPILRLPAQMKVTGPQANLKSYTLAASPTRTGRPVLTPRRCRGIQPTARAAGRPLETGGAKPAAGAAESLGNHVSGPAARTTGYLAPAQVCGHGSL